VYFYFDPREARRSIGTFSGLYEIEWAREMKLAHWYMGYWIKECPTMAYKARFRPCEALGTDGEWRVMAGGE
jgi:arginine-tRNA-protein transferase